MRMIIGFLIGILMACWVFRVTRGQEKNPWGWTIFTLLVWPIPAVIVGARHRRWVMFWLGYLGIYLIAFLIIMFSELIPVPVSLTNFVFHPFIGLVIPLLLTLLISLVLIVRRGRTPMHIFIHLHVGLKILWLFFHPMLNRYMAGKMGVIKCAQIDFGIDWGMILVCLIILWLGFTLSSRELRTQFKGLFVVYSSAVIVSTLMSILLLVLITLSVLDGVIDLYQQGAIANIGYCLPYLVLLLGVIRTTTEQAALKSTAAANAAKCEST